MKYDFDKVINRHGTNSVKYDFFKENNKPDNTIPLWVADMDFEVHEKIKSALFEAVNHGIFGYSNVKEEYFNAVYNWYKNNFNWEIKQEWLIKTPGVIYAISACIRSLTNKGDAVIIQRPVYHPFAEIININKRKLVNNPLVLKDGKYYIDFEDFESKIIEHNVKIFILCSPHNPVGRVWTKDELKQIGDICVKHNVIVIADEIHCDFVYSGYKHYMYGSTDKKYLDNAVICTSPSKTFNLAGLQVSNIFIPNKTLRDKVSLEIRKTGYSQLNTMGLIAGQVAYEEGGQWVRELNKYLNNNLDFVREFISNHLPNVRLIEPEGTYLLWLDFRELGLTQDNLEDLLSNKARIWLNSGIIFGEEGLGFMRLNIACPISVLESALNRLKDVIK